MEILKILLYEKFKYVRHLRNKRIKVLDIGCGNMSPSLTKRFFPNCIYYGIDKETPRDIEKIDIFFKKDLDIDKLSDIEDEQFDYVIISHVLEYLKNPYLVVEEAAQKVKRGGYIYIEFPSLTSFNLPSMKGTLHFCDDNTHVRFVELPKVINILLDYNFKIIKARRRRNKLRIGLFPLMLVYGLIKSRPLASYFWDLLGFADQIFAQRR